MANDEILWITTIPVRCPKCGEDTPQSIGRLIERDAIGCSVCGAVIDVKGENWRTFVQQIAERLSGLTVPVTKRDNF